MKTSIVMAALLISTSAHAEKVWTHLPDGRWMFVDKDPGKMCDMQGTCYPDKPDVAPHAPHDTTIIGPSIVFVDRKPHSTGTGCGNWPLGSDADLDCRRASLLPTAQVVWRLDPNNRWVQIDPNCGGRWDLAPTGRSNWQWTCPGDDWRRDPKGKWQVVPKYGE